MSQFGIVIASTPLRRTCACGEHHECKAFYVRSTVPVHHATKRPARSLVAWYVGEQNTPPLPRAPEGEER